MDTQTAVTKSIIVVSLAAVCIILVIFNHPYIAGILGFFGFTSLPRTII